MIKIIIELDLVEAIMIDFKGYTISLAFKEQIVEKVPTNEIDLPVDLVITN